jgi:FkbM family methyltransferase
VDIGVVRAVIGHRESLVEIDRPRIIIDAGGHIGTSTVVFAAHYPEARVVTLEPDTSNFTLLQQNTAHYPNVLPMQSALWSRDESLQIQNPAAASYSYQVGVNTTNPTTKVPGLSLQTLLDQIAAPSCDLLKLDIEGAEFEVMRDTPPEIWQRIKVVVIELHERIRPGVKALADTTFPASRWTRNEQGEYLILRQK